MTGSWRYTDISNDPDRVSPQAHWLNHVMGASPATFFAVRLTASLAAELAAAFAGERPGRDEPVDRLAAASALPAASARAITRRTPAELDHVSILVAPEGFVPLEELADTAHLDIVAAGPAPEGAATRRAMPPVEPDAPARPNPFVGENAVIVAIVDDGIAPANQRFRLPSGASRIAYYLDMNATEQEGLPAPDAAGRTFSGAAIDAIVAGSADEAEIYAKMGLIGTRLDRLDPLKFSGTHGTAVLDVAAGYGAKEAEAARCRPIIAVELPTGAAEDRSGTLLPTGFDLALDFIRDKAETLSNELGAGRILPIVVNFSFGIHAGPNDGEGVIARRIDAFIEDYRNQDGAPACEVVVAAGNSLQQRGVAVVDAPAVGGAASLTWRLPPDDRTSSYVQIWLPPSAVAAQQVEVSLIPPRDAPATPLATRLGEALDWVDENGKVLARLYHQSVTEGRETPRECIVIAIRPTEEYDTGDITVPPGLFEVAVKNLALAEGVPIEMRIQRDDPEMRSRRRGRQSRWEDDLYPRFSEKTGRLINDERVTKGGPVTRLRTQSEYATGHHSVVVAGYRESDGDPAIYSSSGPTGSGREGPTVAAVSEESPAFNGVLASGTYSGSIVAYGGTSFAAPALTRAIADEIAARRGLAHLLLEIETGGSGAHAGSQGPYKEGRVARIGKGRMKRAVPPPHRRRVDP